MNVSSELGKPVITGIFSLVGAPLVKKLGQQWKRVQWEFEESKYREQVRHFFGKTRLFGAEDDVDIESLFTDVFFLPEASASKRYSVSASSFADYADLIDRRNNERFNAVRAMAAHDRLYILGAPGAGKTTFLKHVALLAAEGKLPELPIFISLKDWGDSGKDFIAFAAHEFSICGFEDAEPVVTALLESGTALLLLDGLDEVSAKDHVRARITQAITELTRKYPTTKMLLTCRTSANDHAFSHFKYVEIADFLPEQQRSFVTKWFKNDPAKGRLFLEQFDSDGSRSFRDLGRKPLFLAFLCISFSKTLELPLTKLSLHAEAVDALLEKWDASRSIQRETYGLTSKQRKRQFLAQLAFRTFELDQYAFGEMMIEAVLRQFLHRLPGSDQLDDLESARLARSLEAAHGLIIERAVGLFSYSHLSIHEYFAALGLVNAIAAGKEWDKLLPKAAVTAARWREVLIHVGSLLQDAESYLRHLQHSIDNHLLFDSDVKVLATSCAQVADDESLFQKFSKDPVRFMKGASSFREWHLAEFYPSPRLSNAITRLERTLIQSMKKYRDLDKPPPASLDFVWRRLEVIRETVSYKYGVPLHIGSLQQADGFDERLSQFIDSQDLYIILLDDVLIEHRDQARRRALGVTWR